MNVYFLTNSTPLTRRYPIYQGILASMSTTLLPPSDDPILDDKKSLDPRKSKTIMPLGKAATGRDLNIPRASDEILDELRRKTAALAAEIGKNGKEELPKKVHNLDEDVETKELLRSLKSTEEHLSPITDKTETDGNPALNLVRDKLTRIYADEPDIEDEIEEVNNIRGHRSKHQEFIASLTSSGKSVSEVQTQWHNYYSELPDHEKHQVWQEFYLAQAATQRPSARPYPHRHSRSKAHSLSHKHSPSAIIKYQFAKTAVRSIEPKTTADIKASILQSVNAGGKLTAVHHLKSLLFGLSLAATVVLLMSFVFFNEAYLAPFISPGQTVSATPILGDQAGDVGPEPKIIIPKINLEVPVVFDLGTTDEAQVQLALESGVVHYSNSPLPGEIGNSVIVGHSSNNILNKGKYKFAFVLLKRLEVEDTLFVHRNGVRYTYKVYKKEIVSPETVSVLNTQERPNTITLITCDPPGTSINRLVVTAEQISPDPANNIESTAKSEESTPAQLPSNAPSLWSRLWPF